MGFRDLGMRFELEDLRLSTCAAAVAAEVVFTF